VIKNVWLLSECQFFVGTLGSHFGSMGYEMQVFRGNNYYPAISVDEFQTVESYWPDVYNFRNLCEEKQYCPNHVDQRV